MELPHHRTLYGKIVAIYNDQKKTSNRRGHPSPDYSVEDLYQWGLNNGYQALYDNWVSSDFDRELAPSFDRLNENLSYTFSNLRLVTNRINYQAAVTLRKRPVLAHDGTYVSEFDSISDASKATGVPRSNITDSIKTGKIRKGSLFVFLDEEHDYHCPNRGGLEKPILQYHNGVFIKEFSSTKEASEQLGYSVHQISIRNEGGTSYSPPTNRGGCPYTFKFK